MNPDGTMTLEERIEQRVKMVYGNIWMEHPGITIELVREEVRKRFGRDGPVEPQFGGSTCTSPESGCRNVACDGLDKSQQ